MGQAENRIPATGESWRHYKGGPSSLYTIIGIGRDADGFMNVIYTEYRYTLTGYPPLYVQLLGRFLQDVENGVPRFKFEREVGDDDICPFIRP